MSSSASTPRHRGAQPGNQNARKHGFYAAQLPPADLLDLDSTQFAGLSQEISLLRSFIRRFVSLPLPPNDYYASLESMRVLCLAVTALARLVRVHALLGNSNDEWFLLVQKAISQAAREMGIDPLHPDDRHSPSSP